MTTEEFIQFCAEKNVGNIYIRANPKPGYFLIDFEYYGFNFFFQGQDLNALLAKNAELIRLLSLEDRQSVYSRMSYISDSFYEARLYLIGIKDGIPEWDLHIMSGKEKLCDASGHSVFRCLRFVLILLQADMLGFSLRVWPEWFDKELNDESLETIEIDSEDFQHSMKLSDMLK